MAELTEPQSVSDGVREMAESMIADHESHGEEGGICLSCFKADYTCKIDGQTWCYYCGDLNVSGAQRIIDDELYMDV